MLSSLQRCGAFVAVLVAPSVAIEKKCSAYPVQALLCVPSFCLIWPKCPTYFLLHAPRCTWDAFYSTVSARGLVEGLGSLHAGGIVPRLLIIDDGWQVSLLEGVRGCVFHCDMSCVAVCAPHCDYCKCLAVSTCFLLCLCCS
jgi:hypothetical protein